MCSNHQVIGFLVQFDKVNIGSRHVVGELVPALAPIQRNVKTKFSTEEKQVFIDIIFLNVSRKTIDLRSYNRFPGSTKVGSFINVGIFISGLVAGENRIGISLIKDTCFNVIGHRAFGKVWNIGNQVGPRFAAIFGQLQIPIVRTGPNNIFIQGRFGNRENRAVIFRT